jgi:putative NIF3 family GTP cyclohydrolase 1 type 2
MIIVRDLLSVLNTAYPLSRAEKWDKVGLQIGDANALIHRVLVAHEVTATVLDEAQRTDADALLIYHPLIFRPLETLDFSNHIARLTGPLHRAKFERGCGAQRAR